MSPLPSSLPYSLDRTVVIRATPAIVFRYFTDSARFANWWGAGSTIDARPGGAVYIRHPGGVEASGEVLEVQPTTRIVFTYGFASGNPIPPGSSRVTIELAPDPAGTKLHLTHDFSNESARDHHVQGWRFQLSLFANVAADEANAGAARVVDAWFDAWAEPDARKREATMSAMASATIAFHDRYSSLESVPDVLAHITASQHFMPGIRMRRTGDIRHCQGCVLADWAAAGPDGADKMRGTNLFVFGPAGQLESVTGFANP